MNFNNLQSLCIFIISILFVGCTSDNKIEEPNPSTTIKSITLEINNTSVEVQKNITFTVKANTGEDVTSKSKITVNGVELNKNIFKSNSAGNYIAKATYLSLTSNELSFNISKPVTNVIIETNKTSTNAGEIIEFTSKASFADGSEEDKTSETIFIVDGTEISGNKFITHKTGKINVKGRLSNITSTEVNVQVDQIEEPTTYTKKAIIEEYTGTWCGYCPRVLKAIELVHAQTDKVFVIAAHGGSSDPMRNEYSRTLSKKFNITGFPTAKLNREENWEYPEPSNITQVTNMATGNTNLGLSINSTLSGDDVQVVVGTGFSSAKSGAKLVVFLLEDGVLKNQSNYTSYYNGANPIVNFEHKHVLRYSATDVLGNAISKTDGISHTSFSFNLKTDGKVSNNEKTGIVAMIVDNTGKKILNAQYAKIGVHKKFD